MNHLQFIFLGMLSIMLMVPASYAQQEPITPINDKQALNQKIVKLGFKLFHDPRLSADNSISCAHCHQLAQGGDDNQPTASGINGQQGERNSPTVLNVSLHIAQFWDGRADTLEQQIDGPIHNPKEMGSNWPQIVNKLKQDKQYNKTFRALYQDSISAQHIKHALATFERSLLTPNSRFDRYLKGDKQAINAREKEGYQLFKSYGCIACHQGQAVGGNLYEKLGVVIPYFTDESKISRSDLGRYNVTGNPEHKFQFKVPSLRNIALTAPYLHDGSVATLDEMIKLMGKHQLGRLIPPQDRDKITAFLQTLTGELPSYAD